MHIYMYTNTTIGAQAHQKREKYMPRKAFGGIYPKLLRETVVIFGDQITRNFSFLGSTFLYLKFYNKHIFIYRKKSPNDCKPC